MASTLERLPRWNLQKSFGYTSPSDPQIDKDLAAYRRFHAGFAKRYKGKVAKLSDEELVAAIERYHAGDDRYTRLSNYATLSYERQKGSQVIKDLYDKVHRKLSEAAGLSVYFEEELTNLPKDRLRAFKANPTIPKKYKKYVESFVESKHEIVSSAQEDAIGMFSPLLDDFQELYEQITANQQFDFKGEVLGYSAMRIKRTSDRDPKVREAALHTFFETVAPARVTYETIMNAGLRYRASHQDLYNYAHPTEPWNVENDIADYHIPLRMVEAVQNSAITQRFFALKAKLMGKPQLDPWDISAHLPNEPDKRYSWKEAREIVIAAFTNFHPQLGAVAKKAFNEGWIDAPPSKGKYSGLGITHEGGKQSHPYVLINWQGDFDSLVTLAHEVGHAVAMHIRKQKLGNILSEQPKLINELCAYFAERMLGEEMERRAQTPQERSFLKYQMLASHQVYSMLQAHGYGAAVALQMQYNKGARRRVTAADLDAWSLKSLHHIYGNTVRHLDKFAPIWVADEQQFSDPFYLGDYPMVCLVSQVLFDKRRSGEIDDLPDRFIKMLSKNSTEGSLNLMKGLGADITQPGFWRKGVNGINREIGALEKLVAEECLDQNRAKKFGNYVQARRTTGAVNSR